MASWMDLKDKCEALNCGATYVSQPPNWFRRLADDANDRPIVVNVRGVPVQRTIVLLTFTEYEALRQQAAGGERNVTN